jgi:glycerophosphoryl diester phosphodiesterase
MVLSSVGGSLKELRGHASPTMKIPSPDSSTTAASDSDSSCTESTEELHRCSHKPVGAGSSAELEAYKEMLDKNRDLRRKLVLHRGWHRLCANTALRPLENTRQAYIDSATLGAAFAECDVWSTRDGVIVLSHDASFQSMAASSCDPELATTPIGQLLWSEIQDLPLSDSSTPVLLETVLADLEGTGTKLVIELKSSGPAVPLGDFIATCGGHIDAIAWVMSFSFAAIETFTRSCPSSTVRTAWLLENPISPRREAAILEGEILFDYPSERLSGFLVRTGMTERFRRQGCGIYLQYRPGLLPMHMATLKADIRAEVPDGTDFVGLWTDAAVDAGFDNVASACEWMDSLDAINSDLPSTFWHSQ